MKRIATILFGLLLLLTYASRSSACQWPPPTDPGPVCPSATYTWCALPGGYNCDTLWIDNVQNSSLSPFAATGDTVRGVGGIFTAIDSITTGFGFYLQRTAPPNVGWTGVDVFSGGTNMAQGLGLVLGDSVVVYGKSAEFGGGTEILSNNNNFTTPNLIIRKVSSGNPVPAFHVGTVHELNFLPSNPSGEKWEGSLVRVASTMRVVRHIGLGTSVIPGANCLVVDNAICPAGSLGPCDSLLIETATLAGISAPPVTGFVNAVQGVFDQRTISGQNSYVLQIRKQSDIEDLSPPHVADAYCVANDTVRVVFNRSVTTASATDPFSYSYASGTTVNAMIMEAGNEAVNLAITPGVGSGATDELTVNNIVATANLVAMSAPESRNYVQGIQTIYTIQGPNPDSLLLVPCEDVGNFLGNNNGNPTVAGPGNTSPNNPVRLTYRGVCIGGVGNVYYIMDAAGGLRSGLSVFAPPVAMITGRKYLIASSLQEFPALAQGLSETEMAGVSYMRNEGAAAVPAASLQTIHLLNGLTAKDKCTTPSAPNAEDFEGMLVLVNNAKETYRTNTWGVRRAAGSSFHVAGPYPGCPDTINIHSAGQTPVTYQPADGAIVNVTGIMHLNFGEWEIYPRTNADIVELSTNSVDGSIPRTISFSTSPNPAKTAHFSFGLPREDRVELAVFDVAGRQVAMIEKATLPAGSYTRAWDGRTDGGSTAGAGLYFYRLKVGKDIRTIHGVRLK